MSIARTVAGLAFATWSAVANGDVTRSVITIPTRNGVTQQFVFVTPTAPSAYLIGLRGFGTYPGAIQYGGPDPAFVELFANRGIAVAQVDAPSDHLSDLIIPVSFRRSPEHVADILEVIRYLRARADVPIWLMSESNGTNSVVNIAINLASYIRGSILASSTTIGQNSLFQMPLATLRSPTLLIAHQMDGCFLSPPSDQPGLLAAFTAVETKQLIVLSGGILGVDPCNGGYHEFEGLDGELVAAVAGFIAANNGGNYQGIWWNAPAESESGWGINLAHQGDTLFAAWYTYDANGRALWFTMLAEKSGPNTYTGKVYENRGPALNAQPFNKDLVTQTEVGDGTLTFTDGENGTFHYTVDGITQTKTLVRFVFGPVPTCTWGALADLSLATNYQDMWWASPPPGAESGWGVTLTHQGDVIFVAWFTYDLDGKPLWLTAIVRKGAPGIYTGAIHRTTGPAFSATPWDKNTVTDTTIGDLTITFANGNHASFHYTMALGAPAVAIDQTKTIERFVFHAPGTVCH